MILASSKSEGLRIKREPDKWLHRLTRIALYVWLDVRHQAPSGVVILGDRVAIGLLGVSRDRHGQQARASILKLLGVLGVYQTEEQAPF